MVGGRGVGRGAEWEVEISSCEFLYLDKQGPTGWHRAIFNIL